MRGLGRPVTWVSSDCENLTWGLFSLHHLHIEAKILLSDVEEYVMR